MSIEIPLIKNSQPSEDIHEWRNVLAHRWLNVAGHQFSYDYTMQEGWKNESEVTVINPEIYLEEYLDAFGRGGRIWGYKKILATDAMLDAAKARFLSKYIEPA